MLGRVIDPERASHAALDERAERGPFKGLPKSELIPDLVLDEDQQGN
jgi:hypothetical protein